MQRSGNPVSGLPPAEAWVAAMRAGHDEAAWQIADAVLATRDPETRDDPRLPYHQRWVWDGRPLEGRDVLVRCYHGLGDTLMFARYLAPLATRAARVTLEAPPDLLPLLRGLPGLSEVAPFEPARPLPAAQADVEIMELAHALRLGPGNGVLPFPPGWSRGRKTPIRPAADPLHPPAREPREGIGLCWTAGAWDPTRSVPLAELCAALGTAGPLVSLQRGPASAEADERFRNPGDDDHDIRRTAALIARSRLVVTVDTMVAHLAGALGAPTLLLLKHDPDWRWGAGAGVCRWYGSITMARQSAPGDWSAPLAAVRRLAASLAAAG